MTKRRMQCLIVLGVFVLFICATLMNYMSAAEYVGQDMNSFWSSTMANEFINQFYESEDRDTVNLHRQMTLGHNPEYSTFVKPAFAFAMIDKDKNVVFKSESGIWWISDWISHEDPDEGWNYISLEEYMTPELKKDLARFQKKVGQRSLLLRSMELNFDGEEYRPVSITLDDQEGDIRKFTFTDLEVTETVDESSYLMYYYLYDLYDTGIDHFYYERVKEQLEETIASYEFTDAECGGGFFGSGRMDWNFRYEDYAFFYVIEYNCFYENITSDMFIVLTVYMAVLFAVVLVTILIVASKLYDKQKNLEQSKRSFVSAAAHELKTPLAVIQNQCECVLDNINPEKNGEYIRSVYDEALRMSGIVKSLLTFNRISDLTQVKKENCNISEIFAEEINKYYAFADTNGAVLTKDIEEGIFAECNGELISIALDNYLSNAIKYATGEKNVHVSLKRDKKGFVCKVYNDFNGTLPEEDMWQVFTRADKARNSSGNSTGMGLPINKKIFELHNYRYWYTSEKSGISFCFSQNK